MMQIAKGKCDSDKCCNSAVMPLSDVVFIFEGQNPPRYLWLQIRRLHSDMRCINHQTILFWPDHDEERTKEGSTSEMAALSEAARLATCHVKGRPFPKP